MGADSGKSTSYLNFFEKRWNAPIKNPSWFNLSVSIMRYLMKILIFIINQIFLHLVLERTKRLKSSFFSFRTFYHFNESPKSWQNTSKIDSNFGTLNLLLDFIAQSFFARLPCSHGGPPLLLTHVLDTY